MSVSNADTQAGSHISITALIPSAPCARESEMIGNKGTVTVAELIELLQEMPQDFKVYSWEGKKRIPISDVVNAGDVVDLYNYDGDQA
jgi:hypothetical protein